MNFEFTQAEESNATEIANLVNSAYRGDSSKLGWTTEADLLGGQRVDRDGIIELISKNESAVLIAQEEDQNEILGCVHIEKQNDKMYLGMLTVKPSLQNHGLGKKILEETEAFADFWDCTKIAITVISVRTELISWYEKLGFVKTGKTQPFPYGDERFGKPKQENLQFEILEKKLSF